MATETRKSDSIEWNTTPEVFQFASNQWDVSQAKELIRTKRARKVENMDISGVAALVGKPPVDGKISISMGISVDWEKAASNDVDLVALLLNKNDLDTSLEVGLMTGYFSAKHGKRYGQAHWIWTTENGQGNFFKKSVYDRVVKLVDMRKIVGITSPIPLPSLQG